MTNSRDLVAALYANALPRLGAYAYLLTGNYADAEDLVQAAMVKVCSRPRTIADEVQAEAYVRATMRTLHIDGLRKQARWRRAVPRLVQADAVAPPDDATVAADAVATALSTLAPRVRATVAMYYWEDLAVRDIAAELGLAEGTVKGYLQDGRQALAQLLGEDPDDERAPVAEVRS